MSDVLFWTVAALAVSCMGLSKAGIVGFGLISTLLLATIVPPMQAAAILLPIMLIQDGISVWSYWKHWDRSVFSRLIPGAAIGISFGWLIAAYASDGVIRLLVGLLALAFVLNDWLDRKPLMAARPAKLAAIFWGTASGFTGMLANAGGPPVIVYLLSQELPKLTFVGTLAVYFAIINGIRIVPFFSLGQISSENIVVSAVLLPVALATNLLGILLVKVTPTELYFRMARAFIFLVSAALVYQGAVSLFRG